MSVAQNNEISFERHSFIQLWPRGEENMLTDANCAFPAKMHITTCLMHGKWPKLCTSNRVYYYRLNTNPEICEFRDERIVTKKIVHSKNIFLLFHLAPIKHISAVVRPQLHASVVALRSQHR